MSETLFVKAKSGSLINISYVVSLMVDGQEKVHASTKRGPDDYEFIELDYPNLNVVQSELLNRGMLLGFLPATPPPVPVDPNVNPPKPIAEIADEALPAHE